MLLYKTYLKWQRKNFIIDTPAELNRIEQTSIVYSVDRLLFILAMETKRNTYFIIPCNNMITH